MTTGWTTGLSQDYDRKLHLWFASRIDARWVVRRFWGAEVIEENISNENK